MAEVLNKVRRALIGVSDKEATAFSKGNKGDTWTHLESAVLTAVGGYNTVLDGGSLAQLAARLDKVPEAMRSYAYEGAAMGLTGMDCFLPGKSRLAAYLDGPAEPHVYMVHIGAGEALARLHRKPEKFLNKRLSDPILRWLVLDGYGFHEGFFKSERFVDRQYVPTHLSPYGRRIFDQGIGRSIWFLSGSDPDRIADRIEAFPRHRQADMWLGIGVACCYVGGVDRAAVVRLRERAGQYADRLAAGAAFVAKGRQRAGNPLPDTELACEVLCGLSSAEAADVVTEAFAAMPATFTEPGYELLQRRLLDHFAGSGGTHARTETNTEVGTHTMSTVTHQARPSLNGPTELVARLVKPFFEVSESDVPVMGDVDPAALTRLKQVVFTVTDCCHLTFFHSAFDDLVPLLDAYPKDMQGFAYEGAGVGYGALDTVMPWKRRTQAFVDGPGEHYAFAVYLGAGMGLGRIRRNPEPFRASLSDPIFSWVVLDGYGFHEGFFRHKQYVLQRRNPGHLSAFGRRVFDHGLGRAIWFVTGADPDRVRETIDGFDASRRNDLWGGVGLACGYTGGVERPTVEKLRKVADVHRSHLAVGTATAARARHLVGDLAEHSEFACEVLCERSGADTAALAEQALHDLPDDPGRPGYDLWRERIRQHFV